MIGNIYMIFTDSIRVNLLIVVDTILNLISSNKQGYKFFIFPKQRMVATNDLIFSYMLGGSYYL